MVANLKAKMKALDNIENMLDDEDAKMGRKFKGSDTDLDDEDHKAPPSDDNGSHEDTQESDDASDEDDKDAPEGEDNWMDELKGMASKGHMGSAKALESLSDKKKRK
jgi:hypothetical protein